MDGRVVVFHQGMDARMVDRHQVFFPENAPFGLSKMPTLPSELAEKIALLAHFSEGVRLFCDDVVKTYNTVYGRWTQTMAL